MPVRARTSCAPVFHAESRAVPRLPKRDRKAAGRRRRCEPGHFAAALGAVSNFDSVTGGVGTCSSRFGDPCPPPMKYSGYLPSQRSTRSLSISSWRIVTTAGLYGRIVSTDEISIRLEVSPGVVLRFSKMAILRVVTPESEAKEAAKAAKIAAERERVKNKGRKPPKPKATPPAASPPTAPPPAHPANGEEPGPKTL